MIYLDYAASAPISDEVLALLNKSMKEDFANASSAHKLGKELSRKVAKARTTFLDFLNGSGFDFYFTSSATESNNTIIKGLKLEVGDEVLYSKADHPSVSVPVETLEKKNAYEHGSIDSILEKTTDKTKLIVLSHVNNQSGEIFDVLDAAEKIKNKNSGVHIHVDGVQSFLKIDFKLNKMIDSYTISSHKIGGPKGISGLYLKQNTIITPLLSGGAQEQGLRSSTLSVPLIFAFEKAAKLATLAIQKNTEMAHLFKKKVSESLMGIESLFHNTSPFIFTFKVTGISSDIILRHLEIKDIFISSSSACSSKVKGDNPTFKALGIDKKYHKNILRVSWGEGTSEKEIDLFILEFNKVIKDLKYLIKK